MGIFILISLGIVIVLLIAYIGKKLGRTMPRKDEMHPWEDEEFSPLKNLRRGLDNDRHVIGSKRYSLFRRR